jgi:hypothetical protein
MKAAERPKQGDKKRYMKVAERPKQGDKKRDRKDRRWFLAGVAVSGSCFLVGNIAGWII